MPARAPRLPAPAAALALLLAAGCAHREARPPDPPPAPAVPAPAPAPAPPPDLVGPVRADAEALLEAQAEILWRAWTAGEPGDAAQALAGRERVLDPASLAAVREAAARAEGDERRALDLLQAFLLGEQLAHRTAPAAAALARSRTQATVPWDGRDVAARRVPALLAAEPDARKRAALERAAAQAAAGWAKEAEAWRRALAEAAGAMGHADLLALAPALRGEPAEGLAARAEAVLEATGAAYRALLEDMARRELGSPLSQLHGRDLPRLFALAQDPRAFPAGKAAERALGTFRAMGLDLAGRPDVELDLAARPGKDPRPLLLPVRVPGAVRVSAAPSGGLAETRGLLRALGGAAYHAELRAEQVELRRLSAVAAEAWGGLFEELAGDPGWLAAQTGQSDHTLEPLVRAAAARRLLAAREAAARVLYEVGRAREPGRAAEVARAVCQRAFARPVEADEAALFAAEPDPLLQAADALAAQLLAAQAEARLRERFGAAWWKDPRAGAWLRSAFAEGARLPPDALSRWLGFERLDAGALVARTGQRP